MLFPFMFRPLILSALTFACLGGPLCAEAAPRAAAPANAAAAQASQALATAALPAGADAAKLEAALNALSANKGDLGAPQAAIVLYKGAQVASRFAPGYDSNIRVNTWNVGASLTAILTGRALQTKALKSVDEPAGLTEWTIAADDRQAITIRNLLQMNSGLKWRERKAGSAAGSDAEQMFFGAGQANIMTFATAAKAQSAPGKVFTYSTGSSVMLASAVQRRLPPLNSADGLRTFAWRKFVSAELFDRLGLRDSAPQFDIVGNYYSSLVWMSPRDMALFGEFCLRDGVWNGERLLPEGWIKFMRTPSGAQGGQSWGAGFWIKAQDNPDPLMAQLPDDAFAAGGDRGAVIVMIPSKDMVIVRTGLTHFGENGRAALGAWLGQIAAAFADVKP